MTDKNTITLKTLTKSNVWELQENDIFRIWSSGEKDADMSENINRYLTIIRIAFDIEEVKLDRPEIIRKYEMRGMVVGVLRSDDNDKRKYAIKKRPILRVTDLTYENIHHISAAKLLEVIDRNFGGGWESISQSIRDIIESGFDISTTTLPTDRLKKPGGLYDKKLADGFEVLTIPKGSWTEAIFAKDKPESLKTKTKFRTDSDEDAFDDDYNEDDDADVIVKDDYYNNDDEDDSYDEDKLAEESYRTTYDEDPESMSLDAVDEGSDDDDY